MALINCKECGKEVSTQAKVCPHCGAKRFKPSDPALLCVAVGFVLLFAFSKCTTSLVETLSPKETPEAIAEASPQMTFPPLPEPEWQPPVEYTLVLSKSAFSKPKRLGYRWLSAAEADCQSSISGCYQMEFLSELGCDFLYVSLIKLDEKGTNVGFTNDTTSQLNPGQKAKLTFPSGDEASARLGEVSCH